MIENPYARLLRELQDSPINRQLRELQDSPFNKQLRELQDSPFDRELRELQDSPFNKQLRELQDTAARICGGLPSDLTRFLGEASAATGGVRGLLAPPDAIGLLAPLLSRAVEPYHGAFQSALAWEKDLAGRMTGLSTAWALPEDLDKSMVGFARLSRLSDAVHSEQPFAEAVSELIVGELGSDAALDNDDAPLARDASAVVGGLSPDLIAFPPPAYGDVVFAAGFKFRLSGAPVPQAIEAADPDAVFDPMHSTVLVEVEQRLRHLLEDRLRTLAGDRWTKQRVPEAVRKRWADRQTEERDAGRPVYTLVQYADFMDLADVIGQTNNWREAFEPIFGNKDDFVVSLRRLHPVRKAIAHGRPLGRADVLTLVSEATRICRALGSPLLC